MTTNRLSRAALPVTIAVLLIAGALPSRAVPVFARKYKTSCQTCHTIFPKLNPFGEAFRLNGYRMPAETEEQIKQAPVPLGSEAYARVWPDAVYPGDLPGNVPLAINVKMANIYASTHDETGRQIVHNDFQFPQEVNLFSAGTLAKTFGFFGELTYAENPDGSSDVEIEHAQFTWNSPSHLWNLKVGKFAPDLADGFQEMWLMTDNGVDTLFAYDPIGFRGGSGVSDSPRGISLPAGVQAIEFYGVAAHRFFYTVGMSNGIGPGAAGTHDGNSAKDFYARLDYKVGGMGLDGDTTGHQLPAENWRENSVRVGLLGYLGDGKGIEFPVTDETGLTLNEQDARFEREGVFVSWYWRDLNVFGVALHGSDRLEQFDPATGASVDTTTRSFNAWFAQADYVFKPPFQASLRYESLGPADPAAESVRLLNANFSFLARANVKAMLEYRRDLHDSLNYTLAAVLRFAY